MKKALLVIAFLLGASPLFAQVKLGAKAGGMVSNLVTKGVGLTSSNNQDDAKLSYLLGAVVTFSIYDRFSLQTELLYSNKGVRTDLDGISGTISDNYHYLSVPLLIRYQVTEQLGVGIGPELGYLLGAYQRSDVSGSNPIPVDRFYKPWDVAVNLDVQYDLLEKLSLGLRYNLGVYDVTKRYERTDNRGDVFVLDNDVYNRSIQLSLYYWFR